MKRPPLALFILLTAAGITLRAAIPEPSVPPPEKSAAAGSASTNAQPGSPARTRAISPATASLLSASLPKASPLKPVVETTASEQPDLRDLDRPRNGIVRLPQIVVQESRPPVFREQDIFTRQAFARRLARRYYSEGYLAFSKAIGFTPLALIFSPAEETAMAQFHEEERLRNQAGVADQVKMLMTSNPAAADKLRKEATETFLRWSDLGWSNKPR